ncbi:hypothetical protein [Pseudoxanthomonas sp. X-1]|uniref:hypothetical protein n=1 Tax=Pseudoxanthomonas sp. X-1 TaxID=2571115 RepID=UPI00110BF704|nr:hypothetical protein [Pseudoxanthomonas sp. X-1]TMN18490.1 hypothetical protein FF950_14515 [Pseudoxanthomonas sp. X-1]UAY76006.1 hypothetical protein LAJ50_07150 [Pseudoxanthomonas sp. X-1]
MKIAPCVTLISCIAFAGSSFAQTYVQPYFRADGTYVEGHYRSEANNNPYDNYSTQGNYNPYTGQEGTVDPYSQPYQAPIYSPPQPYSQPRIQRPPQGRVNRRSAYGN